MRLDSSTFPVVKIFFDAPDDGGPEDALLTFEHLLAREQPFLLLHEKPWMKTITNTPTKSASAPLSG